MSLFKEFNEIKLNFDFNLYRQKIIDEFREKGIYTIKEYQNAKRNASYRFLNIQISKTKYQSKGEKK